MKLLLISLVVAYAAADVSHILAKSGEANAKIIRQDFDAGPEGQYQWQYETENGISAREQGALRNIQAENPALEAQGEARWTAPDGQVIEFQYIANENGYQVQGNALPTPPPIPPEIQRALEYIRAHPIPENQQ
ncbi:larval cuticle protein LCP-17-like [Aricia agestis]|uniref:larval cuticle protein LCP-17-like n=1 Tax=Aricia agestis TaxID=91739 RepID=UPI001C204653|nr:larval cuticle protein LCP-17-like [Aricia agestis]